MEDSRMIRVTEEHYKMLLEWSDDHKDPDNGLYNLIEEFVNEINSRAKMAYCIEELKNTIREIYEEKKNHR